MREEEPAGRETGETALAALAEQSLKSFSQLANQSVLLDIMLDAIFDVASAAPNRHAWPIRSCPRKDTPRQPRQPRQRSTRHGVGNASQGRQQDT